MQLTDSSKTAPTEKVNKMFNLPKGMQEIETCIACGKKMEIYFVSLCDDEKAVEVWQRCECGERFGISYTAGYVEMFKNAIKLSNKKKEEITNQQKSL